MNLIVIENPFNSTNRKTSVIDCEKMSLQEIREEYIPAEIDIHVYVNGIRVENLEYYFPNKGDSVLFYPAVHDGKDLLRTVAMLAVVVASFYVGGLAVGALGPTLLEGGALVAGSMIPGVMSASAAFALGAGATMLIGGMLVNALLPPQQPESRDYEKINYWNPVTTQTAGGAIPRYYGLNKLHGNVIGSFIDIVDNKQYLNLLIALGYGPFNKVYDFKINEQEIDKYSEIEVPEVRFGLLSQSVITNFNDTKTTERISQKVTYDIPRTYTTSANDFNSLEIIVNFPSGVYHISDDGSIRNSRINYTIEYKKSSEDDSQWQYLTSSVVAQDIYETKTGWFLMKYENVMSTDTFSGTSSVQKQWVVIEYGGGNYDDHTQGEYEDREIVYDGVDEWGFPKATWTWKGQWWWKENYKYLSIPVGNVAYFDTAIGDQINPVIVSKYKITPDIISSKGQGTYDIRVTRLTEDNNSIRVVDDMYFDSVRAVYEDDFSYPRIALVGLKALATDQISGSVDFSCMCECLKIRVYDGTNWTVEYNNNPAWVCYDILTQPVFDNDLNVERYDCYDPAYLDEDSFKEWADFCDTKGIHFNGGFISEQSVWEAARKVCEIGRASMPIWNGNKMKVVVDKAETASFMFTIGNSNIDSFVETILSVENRVSDLEANFINADLGYEPDKMTVFNTSINLPSNKATIDCIGLTDPGEVWKHLKYRLACNQYLVRMVSLDVEIEAITCNVGDVGYLQSDVPQWGYGGRITQATINTVTLDREITMSAGVAYSILVRLSDDTIVQKTVITEEGTTDTITINGSFDTVPSQYDVYSFGQTATVAKLFRVVSIQKTSDFKCSIGFIEYYSEIYDADTGSVDIPEYNYSALDTMPEISDIILSESAKIDESGRIVRNVHGVFTLGTNAIFRKAEIYVSYKNNNVWSKQIPMGSTIFNSFDIINVPSNTDMKVFVVPYNMAGISENLENASYGEITTGVLPGSGTEFIDAKVSGLEIFNLANSEEFEGRDCKFIWNDIVAIDYELSAGEEDAGASYFTPNVWLKDYEVKIYDSTGDTLYRTEYIKENQYVYSLEKNIEDFGSATASFRVEVKARDIFSRVSDTAAFMNVSNSVPSNVGTLTTEPYEDGVTFSWAVNTEEDIKGYYVRWRVTDPDGNVGDWSNWKETTKNTCSIDLTSDEKADQAWQNSTITAQVKAVDWYDQTSATATEATATCQNKKAYITVGTTSVLGDFTDLDTAIGKLPSGGGKIVIKNGTYQASDVITIPDKHLEIEGESQGGVVLRNAISKNLFVLHNLTKEFSFSNFSIESINAYAFSYMIYFYGDTASDNTATLDIDRLKITGRDDGSADGIGDYAICSKDGRSTLRVLKSTIIGGARGVYSGGDYVEVKDNLISRAKSVGILGQTGGSKEVILSKNILEDMYIGGILWDGNQTSTLISNNTVKAVETDAIGDRWYGILGLNDYAKVLDNTIYFNNSKGISFFRGIASNLAVGQSNFVEIARNNIRGNLDCTATIIGIDFAAIKNGNIIGNAVEINKITPERQVNDCFNGIYLRENLSSYYCENNIISLNKCVLTDTGQSVGISLSENCNYNRGTKNSFYGCSTNISDNGTGNYLNISGGGTF